MLCGLPTETTSRRGLSRQPAQPPQRGAGRPKRRAAVQFATGWRNPTKPVPEKQNATGNAGRPHR
eukprot:11135147-Lingulodinium_polyedra.AAC.1